MISVKLRGKGKAPDAARAGLAVSAEVGLETPVRQKADLRWGRELAFVIEQSGVQMAAASWYGRSCKLVDAHKTYIPSSAGSLPDRETFILQTVSEYISELGGSWPTISLALSGPQTVFRTFTMPDIGRRQLETAVRFEARKQIPFPINDCQYDYRPIARIERQGTSRLKIGLHAATKVSILQQLSPFTQLTAEVSRVYHTQEVLGQLLRRLPDFREDKHVTLLNIERDRSEVAYYRGAELEFYHVCTLGSSSIAGRSDATVIEYFAESLAGEIQNSLDYYTGQVSSQYASRIYIYGDWAYTEELVSLMSDRFGFEFRRFPIEDLRLVADKTEAEYESHIVCLPAIAAACCNVNLANLLPAEQKLRQKAKRVGRYSLAAMLATAALLGIIWLMMLSGRTSAQQNLVDLNNEIEEFKQSRLFDTYNSVKQQIALNQAYLERAKAEPSHFGLMLKELSNLTPASIRLKLFNFEPETSPQNLQLQGTVSSTSVFPEVILAEFVENLKASPLFREVTVVRYTKRPVAAGFELDFDLSAWGMR